MLLLEFLLMGRSLPADDPLARWDREQLQRQFAAWRARSDPNCVRTLRHLDPAIVFELSEPERPTSVDLAIGLGLSLPERRVLRRVTELSRPTPAMLGCRPTTAERAEAGRKPKAADQRSQRPVAAVRPFYRRWYRVRPVWKMGDDDLGTFLALVIGIALTILLVAMLYAVIERTSG
jgi:hypothetical protein